MNRTALQAGLRFIDSWLEYRMRNVDIPGLSVAMYHRDGIVFERAYGYANLEHGEAMTPEHLFCVASQSKMFTATAILQMVDAGKLRLDDCAVEYLPWLRQHTDQRVRDITIRQLLSHRAGLLRDSADCSYWLLQRPMPDADELRAEILSRPLAVDPNTQLKYSNLGIALFVDRVGVGCGQTGLQVRRVVGKC